MNVLIGVLNKELMMVGFKELFKYAGYLLLGGVILSTVVGYGYIIQLAVNCMQKYLGG